MLAVAAVQVLVPAVLLAVRWQAEGPRPATEYPASWQMYTATPPPTYRGIDAQGASRALVTDGLVELAVGTGGLVPRRLCDREPGLRVVVRVGGPDPGRFPC